MLLILFYFSIFIAFLSFFIGFISWGIATFSSYKLYFWLKKNKYERWEELTTTESNWGEGVPGLVNTYRSYAYLDNDVDNEIPYIYDLKVRYKKNKKIALKSLTIFLFFFIAFIFLKFATILAAG